MLSICDPANDDYVNHTGVLRRTAGVLSLAGEKHRAERESTH